MVKYTVYNYSFNKPAPISEREYLLLKQKLQNDPSFSLMNSEEKITNEFNFKYLIYLYGGSVGAILFYFILDTIFNLDKENPLWVILILGMFAFLGAIIATITSIPSLFNYARYIKMKRKYFIDIATKIRKSNSYAEFFEDFY